MEKREKVQNLGPSQTQTNKNSENTAAKEPKVSLGIYEEKFKGLLDENQGIKSPENVLKAIQIAAKEKEAGIERVFLNVLSSSKKACLKKYFL